MTFRINSFLRSAVLCLTAATVVPTSLSAQDRLRAEDLRVIPTTSAEPSEHDMVLSYLLRQAEVATQKRLGRFNAVRTEAEFSKWQAENRQKFLELIGGLPTERAPLHARITGEVARDGYVVRNVIFESLPEFYVTANLYVPTVGKPPFPAILSPCGHSANGKAYDVYQHLFIGLAKRGYVVLTYDPQGQGERIQYWDILSNRRSFEFNQHGMAGIQEYLLGQNLARYFIWDGMRAIDYLTSLHEVDASRIGVTGSSGGGTLTTYITMLDPRVKVASIVTFITSLPKKIENRINDAESDPEQDIAGLLANGIDHTEYLGLIAPRPVQIGSAVRDFFPIEGTRTTFAEAQRVYMMLGVPDHIRKVEFDHKHMYSQPLREATYTWFDRWLKGADVQAHEPPITTEKDAVLQCTPTGQVVTSLGGKTMFDFNRAEAERLERRLAEIRSTPDFSRTISSKISARMALPSDASDAKPPQKVGETQIGDLVVEKYWLTSEEGIVVPTRVIFRRAHAARMRAVVYLRDRSGADDHPEFFEELARHGRVVAVADVRGFGETMSARHVPEANVGYFDPRDGMDADFTIDSFFLGRPLLGMRVRDARAVVSFLSSRPEVDAKHIAIAGRGWAASVALFTAATDPKIAAVAIEGPPVSFSEIAAAKLYNQPLSLMLPGALQDFDLPDVFASLAPRPLLVLNPENAMTRKMNEEEARQAVAGVRQVYGRSGAEHAFEVAVLPFDSEAQQAFLKWIEAH